MNWDEMAVVGRIARPHGIRGHIVVNPETDFPEERFRIGAELFVNRTAGVEGLTVTASRLHAGRPIVALAGVEDVDAARALAGLEIRVPAEWLTPLPEGVFYHHELVGSPVETLDGEQVGRVVRVEGDHGTSRLVVEGERGEVLIPLTLAICTRIEPGTRIVIEPPAGLLELNQRPR
ncbi:MAG: ribosome maturation factor RimM [Vicinamibacterales bacterium]